MCISFVESAQQVLNVLTERKVSAYQVSGGNWESFAAAAVLFTIQVWIKRWVLKNS